MHTTLDLHGAIRSVIHVSNGRSYDVNVLDLLLSKPRALCAMIRGYLDFASLYHLDRASSFFLAGAKHNLDPRRPYSTPVDCGSALLHDQAIALN